MQAVFMAGVLAVASAQAAPVADLSDALEAGTPAAFAEALQGSLTAPERQLARGLHAALSGRDGEAARHLTAAMADEALSPALRRRAAEALAGVLLRAEDFDGAARAFDVADSFEALDEAAAQARAFVEPLRALPGISRGPLEPACTAITKDLAGLPRAGLGIGGQEQDAIVDTGAAFSTVMASAAERLGIRPVEGDVSVGSAAADAVQSGLGVADSLEIGGAVFRDVVFIVLPDEALTFAGGAYTIEMILGMPVLMRLERLTFEAGEAGSSLCFEPSAGSSALPGNLYLQALAPIILAEAEGADKPLHLLLDTGAQQTNLSLQAIERHPELARGAAASALTFGGAGGFVTDADAIELESLTFYIGERPVTLGGVTAVSQGTAGRRDGILGQDALSAGRGFRIDFKALTLEILEP